MYDIFIYTTEVLMHAIRKPYMAHYDFGIFENDLVCTEMLHRWFWLDSVCVRPQAYHLFNSYGVSFAVFKVGSLLLFT